MRTRRPNPKRHGAARTPAHPQTLHHPRPGTSDLFLGILLPGFTVLCSFENFQVVSPNNALKAYQEFVCGAIAVAICVPYMLAKLYDFPDLSPMLLTFKSWIRLPTCPADVRIFRDTAIVVILSYVLLLDISLSYLWLAVFPVVAIVFIYALCRKLCPPRPGAHRGGGEQQQPDSAAAGRSSSSTGDGSVDVAKAKNAKRSDDHQEALTAIAAAPFCALLVMAQLPDRFAATFAVSQFLLFLSTTLGALTSMMTRIPAGGVTPTSRLLHRASLLALLATAHTAAAESLGEHVVLFLLPELAPVLLWFSLHLDRDGSIFTVDDIKPRTPIAKGIVLAVLGAVAVPLFAYLATFMDEPRLAICMTVSVSCAVSGLLTSYLVFMLRQWPGCNNGGRGKQITTGSPEEAVRLLMVWANTLLISAAALLLLQHLVAVRIGLQEPLVDQLAKILNQCADKYLPH